MLTNIIPRASFTEEEIIVITANFFIFNDAMSTDRNSCVIDNDAISKIIMVIKLKSIPITFANQSFINKIIIELTRIPKLNRIKDALTKIMTSSNLSSAKLLPMKRLIPIGVPTVAPVKKIVAIATIVEEIPIISEVVIFVKTNQKIYPKSNPTKVSMNRKTASLFIFLLMKYHPRLNFGLYIY